MWRITITASPMDLCILGTSLAIALILAIYLWRSFKKRKGGKSMILCKDCGRRIDFIKSKSGSKIPVNARQKYFIPDESFGAVVLVTSKGIMRKGRRAADGVAGHELHKCRERKTDDAAG